ncbi:hypothetical protein GH714_019319 [Hevea brasiliensis]|uniref:Serine aminopeptidase S33 domain-containing protein n=1 Tax=Hevea brasiliensis TaxID=3981 RepID=A0A6A6MDS5_HEVBR|nr:hypothetical protein GH714_019319 [Hevea brasiliensis]
MQSLRTHRYSRRKATAMRNILSWKQWCRADASEAAIILLPSNITVFTLDFSGSGISGGEHVTLGWNEKDDLRTVVDYLRQDGNVSLIGLWGRSMGAVTSLMYGAEDPSIAGMVLDSPFSDLVDLMMELVKFAIQYMRRAIQKKAKFDIMDLKTIKVAKSCFVPALFGHAIDDDFIQPHHSDRIFEAYVGDKNIIKFEGDHNSPRPQFYFDSINIFFHNVLHPPEDEVGGTYFDTMLDNFGKGDWSTVHEVGNNLEFSVASKEPSTSSGEDAHALEQVRPKRPMSRTEVPSEIPSEGKQSEVEVGEINNNHLPSSSKMISFELSNGHPYGPHVPTMMDDDQYVEYQLDDLAGFPCNVEEEERMFMEAVIASLKDLEMRYPNAEQEQASVNPTSMESSQKHYVDASSIAERCGSLKTVERHEPSKIEPASSPATSVENSATEHPSPDPSVSSSGPAFDTPPSMTESGSTGTSTRSDASGSVQNSTDTDMSSNTKATLTVERNPASHIMDGLMRRWDFSLFRNR